MIIVLDASTLINLANGGVLGEVLSLKERYFRMSGAVRKESKTAAKDIDAAVANGALQLIDDSVISIQAYEELRMRFNLGEGETECIVAARDMGWCIACDDGAARTKAARELGADRVSGSVGLLQAAREEGHLTADQCWKAYSKMVEAGGYLPTLPADFFG